MTAILLVGVLVLILVNAFFVSAEFALVRARRSRLEQMADEDARARLAVHEIDEISEYLSACQLGVTLASVGIGFLGEPAVANLIHPWLGGAVSHGVALAISLTIAYVVTTSLHITIGEQVPKLFALSRAETMARAVARPLHWFTKAFGPFVAALNGASNAILRLLRVDPSVAFTEGGTPEDLRLLINQSLQGGQLDPEEALMLSGVFELHEQEARQVMTPIHRVATVSVDDDAQTASEMCIRSGHTRLLVTEDSNPDRIKGVIHANSLLGLILADGPAASIADAVLDALIVPESQPLDTLLAELRQTRNSLAAVVDEYGRTAGIVAIEDIVEEIVGEIADETDPSTEPIRRLADGQWLVQGDVPLGDLRDHDIVLESDSDAYNSIGGLVLDSLGHVPKPGETLTVDDLQLTVDALRGNRIELIRVTRPSSAPPTDAGRTPPPSDP
jgi:CBS domain containing-hemolysin-like protein